MGPRLKERFAPAANYRILSPARAETRDEAIARAVANPQRSEADRLRDATSKPAAVLSFIDLRPGMHVADVISGGGYWSELMSYVVGPKGSGSDRCRT